MFTFTGSILSDVISFLLTILVVIYVLFIWSFQTWKRKNVPYFEPSFPNGNRSPINKGVSFGEDVFNTGLKAKEKGWKYFGYYFHALPIFIPLDLEIIKHILTKDFNHFTDRGTYYNEKDDPLSAHLFSIGGVKWRNLRTKFTPTFTSGKMKRMFKTLVDSGSQLEKFLKEQDYSRPIEIKHVLGCFSADIIGSCAFGIECNSLKEPDAPFLKYGRKVLERTLLEQITSAVTFSFPNFSRALHLRLVPTDVTQFFYKVVTEAVIYRERNNILRNDFLQLLIEIKNNEDRASENIGDGTKLTMDEIVAQSFVFFFAGFETSSTTMTFALFELSINPEIQEKVRRELLTVLQQYDNKLCYESVKKLEYMQQVIDETLRKYPPLPFVTRKCVRDYKIPNTEVTLEKGSLVLIPIKNIHYSEEFYEDPEKFDPERFTLEKKQSRNQYAHLPFGEGPRICIGLRFGLMQTKLGLASILRNYSVTLNSKTKVPLEMDPKSFVASAKGGVWLNLEKL